MAEDGPSRAWASGTGLRWWCAGAVLIIFQAALTLLSARFGTDRLPVARPVLLLVCLEVLAGLTWLVAVWPPGKRGWSGRSLLYLVVVGLIPRALMLVSTPMLEDDFHRYLWDGAVVAHGHSPYAHAPAEFLAATGNGGGPVSGLSVLARDGHAVLSRVNHPELRTIYPPLAQSAFALAYWLSPWSLVAWRVVLLFLDAVTMALLLLLLRRLGLPLLWSAVYWWNPLLIHETVNAAHMDVLALPFVLGGLLLALHARPIGAVVLVSLAAGVKVWPVILLPFLLRPLFGTPRRLVAAVMVAVGILSLMMWPTAQGIVGSASGFAAYAQRWEMNDALFMAGLYAIRTVLGWFGQAAAAPFIARGVTVALLAGWIGWLAWRPLACAVDLPERMLLVVAGLFLLSPTQFPWYGLWMLPLLVLRPRLSLLLLTVLLPLYRLRFHFDARDQATLFDNGIVWIEYLPVWGCLLWEAIRRQSWRGGVVAGGPTTTVKGGPL
jgi:hypothetical protein